MVSEAGGATQSGRGWAGARRLAGGGGGVGGSSLAAPGLPAAAQRVPARAPHNLPANNRAPGPASGAAAAWRRGRLSTAAPRPRRRRTAGASAGRGPARCPPGSAPPWRGWRRQCRGRRPSARGPRPARCARQSPVPPPPAPADRQISGAPCRLSLCRSTAGRDDGHACHLPPGRIPAAPQGRQKGVLHLQAGWRQLSPPTQRRVPTWRGTAESMATMEPLMW